MHMAVCPNYVYVQVAYINYVQVLLCINFTSIKLKKEGRGKNEERRRGERRNKKKKKKKERKKWPVGS